MFHVQIHGASDRTRVFSYKSRITGETTEFYPECGLVTIEGAHYRTGKPYYTRESRKEFLLRAAALSLELKAMPYADERRDLQRCLDVMVQAAQAAGAQGDPFDAGHMRDMVNARPARAAVAMGGAATIDGVRFETPVGPIPTAPPDKPVKDLGGTTVVTPSRLIIPGR